MDSVGWERDVLWLVKGSACVLLMKAAVSLGH